MTHPAYSAGWVHDICRRLEQFSQEVAEKVTPSHAPGTPRHGKQLAHDTLVPPDRGAVTTGDLRPGDFVYAPSGAPSVLAISDEARRTASSSFTDGSTVACHGTTVDGV